MKHITFYLDFISPYAYVAFEQLPVALMGQSYTVTYKPLLFAALLKYHGHFGPAELASKRDWTYRHVQWLAHRHGIDLALPSAHPFNPLDHLRLALACPAHGQPNRYVCETIFHHVWRGGLDANDPQRMAALAAGLAPLRDPTSDLVKAQLKANADEAIALEAFGVPTFVVDDKLFWGFDALPMLCDYLKEDAWFDGPQWNAPTQVQVGARRS